MHMGSKAPAEMTMIRHPNASLFPTGYLVSFALTTSIFFIWGMSNNLTDILVQQFKKSFELSLLEAQLVQTSVFLAYGIMATPAAFLMRRFGYKAGLVIGLLTFGIGTLLFWPARDHWAVHAISDCAVHRWMRIVHSGDRGEPVGRSVRRSLHIGAAS